MINTVDYERIDNAVKNTDLMIKDIAGLAIKTDSDEESAASFLIKAKTERKKLEDLRLSITRPLDESKKKIMELFKPPVKKIDDAISWISREMTSYAAEKRKKQKELEDKLRAQAEAEARKKKEELEARAAKWEERGNDEKAEMLRDKAEEVEPEPAVVIPISQKPAGTSYRDNWSAVIVDQNAIPREYMMPNEKMLNGIAKATKGTTKIPGVKFVNNPTVVSRTV